MRNCKECILKIACFFKYVCPDIPFAAAFTQDSGPLSNGPLATVTHRLVYLCYSASGRSVLGAWHGL
jgi:hypothetical protein